MKKLLIWDFDNTIAYRTPGMWHAAMVEAIAGDQPELNGKVNKLKPFLMSGFLGMILKRSILILKLLSNGGKISFPFLWMHSAPLEYLEIDPRNSAQMFVIST